MTHAFYNTLGTYHYSRRMNAWNIYRTDWVSEDGNSSSASYVMTCMTKEEASKKVYELNGWSKKNN